MESILSSRSFLLRPVRFPLETFASIRFGLCLEGAGRRGWNAAIRSGLSHNQTITRVRPTSDSAISTTRLFTRRNLLRHIIGVGSGASMITTPGCFSRNPTNTVYPGDPTQLGLRATSKALRSRAQSPVELTKRCLERITRLDPQLNSFITVTGGGWEFEPSVGDAYRACSRGGVPCAVGNMLRIASIRHPPELRFITKVDHIFRSPIS